MGKGDDDERDSLFEVLGHARRRHTMRVLKEHESVALADVADEISVQEAGRSIGQIDPEAVQEVYLSLYHVHVPKLVNADLVVYDEEHDLLNLTDRGRDVKLHVDAVEGVVERAEDEDQDRHISVQLSLATIEAIHTAIESDDRFDPFCSYDEIIRRVLNDVYIHSAASEEDDDD